MKAVWWIRRTFIIVVVAYFSLTCTALANPKTCVKRYYKERVSEGSAAGIAATDAERLVQEVASSIGLDKGFTVVPCYIEEKAHAWYASSDSDGVPEGEYLIYNPKWIQEVIGDDRTQAIAIFGHELGHLLNRHFTAQRKLSTKVQETQADHFAGCAVARMNGDWAGLEDVLSRLRNVKDDEYPNRNESLAAARKGFETCGGSVVPKKIAKPLFPYIGPPVTASVGDLSAKYPSGKWYAADDDGSAFFYITDVLGEEMTLIFTTYNGGQDVKKAEFQAVARYDVDSNGTVDPANRKKKAHVERMCGPYYEHLRAALESSQGGILDRPVERSRDLATERRFETNYCKYSRDNKCQTRGTTQETEINFNALGKVSLTRYYTKYVHYEPFQTSEGKQQWTSKTTWECGLATKVSEPSELANLSR